MSHIENLGGQQHNNHSGGLVFGLQLGLPILAGGEEGVDVGRKHYNNLDGNFLQLGTHHSLCVEKNTQFVCNKEEEVDIGRKHNINLDGSILQLGIQYSPCAENNKQVFGNRKEELDIGKEHTNNLNGSFLELGIQHFPCAEKDTQVVGNRQETTEKNTQVVGNREEQVDVGRKHDNNLDRKVQCSLSKHADITQATKIHSQKRLRDTTQDTTKATKSKGRKSSRDTTQGTKSKGQKSLRDTHKKSMNMNYIHDSKKWLKATFKDNNNTTSGVVKKVGKVLKSCATDKQLQSNVNCGVKLFGQMCKKFDERQKRWVEEMGFGSLLYLIDWQLPSDLSYWLMTRIDPLNEFFIACDGNRYRLSKIQVWWVLGIPIESKPVPREITSDEMRRKLDDFAGKYGIKVKFRYTKTGKLVKSKGIPITPDLMERAVKTWEDHEEVEFKMLFLLLALHMVLCPTQEPQLASDLIPALTCVLNATEYDWCALVLDKLISRVKTFAQSFHAEGYPRGCGECNIYIMIFYLDRLKRYPLDWGMYPRIKVWTVEKVSIANNEDRHWNLPKVTYGKLGCIDVAYGERHPREARDTVPPKDTEMVSLSNGILGAMVFRPFTGIVKPRRKARSTKGFQTCKLEKATTESGFDACQTQKMGKSNLPNDHVNFSSPIRVVNSKNATDDLIDSCSQPCNPPSVSCEEKRMMLKENEAGKKGPIARNLAKDQSGKHEHENLTELRESTSNPSSQHLGYPSSATTPKHAGANLVSNTPCDNDEVQVDGSRGDSKKVNLIEDKVSHDSSNLECGENVKGGPGGCSRRKKEALKKNHNYSVPVVHQHILTSEESKIIAYVCRRSSPQRDPPDVESKIVLDVKGVFCTLGELRAVMVDGGHMTSQVVRAISASLNSYWNRPNTLSRHLILDPSFMQTAIVDSNLHGKKTEVYNICKPSFLKKAQAIGLDVKKVSDWQSCSIFFVPCCLENHWFCYSFNLQDKRIEVLDSMYSSTDHEDMHIKEAVCQAFRLALNKIDKNFNMEDWEFCDAMIPRQNDGHSCGHYMMMAIKLWNGYWSCTTSELESYFAGRGRKLIAEALLGDSNDVRSSLLLLASC